VLGGFRMPRQINLLSSRSHNTLLATTVERSQSLHESGTVSKALCKNGT
jgi:hypothetical protein